LGVGFIGAEIFYNIVAFIEIASGVFERGCLEGIFNVDTRRERGGIILVLTLIPLAFCIPRRGIILSHSLVIKIDLISAHIGVFHIVNERGIRVQTVNGDLLTIPNFLVDLDGYRYSAKIAVILGKVGIETELTAGLNITALVKLLYLLKDILGYGLYLLYLHS
jgi:hypothetical protein